MARTYKIISILCWLLILAACGDDKGSNSFAAKDDRPSSSSAKSSSFVSGGSCSSFYSEELGEGVMPSGTYNCRSHHCITTEFLNQELLEAGKYGEILDERDDQVYKTIKIGEQVWLAQNLNYYEDHKTTYAYCLNNNWSNCNKYGRLYSNKSNASCPDGWRKAEDFEWQQLIAFVGDSSTASQKLISQIGWTRDGVDVSGTDDYGFSMVATGYRTNTDEYTDYMYQARFLLRYRYRNRDEDYIVKFYRYYHEDDGEIGGNVDYNSYIDKFTAVSIRCIQDTSKK
jgi:uncharacterized protein (TIGR02145 family)